MAQSRAGGRRTCSRTDRWLASGPVCQTLVARPRRSIPRALVAGLGTLNMAVRRDLRSSPPGLLRGLHSANVAKHQLVHALAALNHAILKPCADLVFGMPQECV